MEGGKELVLSDSLENFIMKDLKELGLHTPAEPDQNPQFINEAEL